VGGMPFDAMHGNVGDYFMGRDMDGLIARLMENDQNVHGAPPAAKASVAALRRFEASKEMEDDPSQECVVCRDRFSSGQACTAMPCEHIYHDECLSQWLGVHNSCPMCRMELPTDDDEYERAKQHREERRQSQEGAARPPGGTGGGSGAAGT